MAKLPPPTERFFAFMQEREQIRLRKLAGEPWPWTQDKILMTYKFTNVKREHDRTSQLLIEEFYKPNFNAPREQLLLNCCLARYFGTIEFMRAIGWQTSFRPKFLKDIARTRSDRGERVFTGAYIITSGGQSGPKEETVINEFVGELWRRRRAFIPHWDYWKGFCETLMTVPGFGGSGFLAKEVCLDTFYTSFWEPGTPLDKNTWTPTGPGARRGAACILEREPETKKGKTKFPQVSSEEALRVCRELYAAHKYYWPKNYVKLELTDIQWALCEFSKYERTRLGIGKPKALYRYDKGKQLELL